MESLYRIEWWSKAPEAGGKRLCKMHFVTTSQKKAQAYADERAPAGKRCEHRVVTPVRA